MSKLINILSKVVNSKTEKVIYETVSKALLDKFANQTEDSIDKIKTYIKAFDRFKESLPPNERDIQKYEYKDVKKIVDERVSKQKRKKEQDETLSKYMSERSLGKGMNIEDIKTLLRKYYEIQPYLPKELQNIFKISGSVLSKLINDKFSDIFVSENFKKFKKERQGETTDEEIMVRLERYINSFNEVPRYTKPVHDMNFDEFEKVADILPSKDEDDSSGVIDLSDTEVVYEDDNVLIFHPDKKQKCINIRKKYAPNRGWCTSWEGSGNYYYNYRLNQNLTLYYVINKKLDLSDKDFASVILVEPYGGMRLADGSNSGRYAGGSVIPWDEITQKIPVIKDKKELFVAKPLSDEEQLSMRQLRNINIQSDAIKELGSEERTEQWLEITSPNLARMNNGNQIYKNLTDSLKKKYIGLGLDLTGVMINDSSTDVVKYLLVKKKETLMTKRLDDLNDIDIALLNSSIMSNIKEKLRDKYGSDIIDVSENRVEINYPRDKSSKYIALYGFDDFFKVLPKTIDTLVFTNESNTPIDLDLPQTISNFNNLESLHLQNNVIKSLPKEISKLSNLMFLSLPNNQSLTTIPKEIGEKINGEYVMKDLSVINLAGKPSNFNMPKEVKEMMDSKPGFHYFT